MLFVPALLNHISISMGQVHIVLRKSHFHMICCEVPSFHPCSPKKPPVAKSNIRQHPQHRPQQEHSLIGIVLPALWKIDAWLWASWEKQGQITWARLLALSMSKSKPQSLEVLPLPGHT